MVYPIGAQLRSRAWLTTVFPFLNHGNLQALVDAHIKWKFPGESDQNGDRRPADDGIELGLRLDFPRCRLAFLFLSRLNFLIRPSTKHRLSEDPMKAYALD